MDAPLHDPDEPDDDIRKVSADLRDFLIRQHASIADEHSAMARWLTASLLIVNAGGALAVFNATDRLQHPTVNAAPFIVGGLAALLVGVFIQYSGQASSLILGEAIGDAIVSAATGQVSEESKAKLAALGPRISAQGKWPVRLGWASAALFALGAILTGVDERPKDPAAAARCLAIQRDMLSARPRRTDGPNLFQALGCRPQGEGSVYAPKPSNRPNRSSM